MVKKVLKTFEIEYLQVLDEKGNCDQDLMPDLSKDQIKKLYELMILVRTFDDKAFSLQRQGRIGTYIQFKGQEASQVGAIFALEDKDWLFPMYRNSAALIGRKQPMHKILQYWGGDIRGLESPKEVNNFPISISVGTHTIHSVGAAWASKLRGKKDVSLAFMGDGATSKADFLVGLNFAGVYQAPVILICENNQFAISVPRKIQTHSETIAQKAIGAGIKGLQVDGNDVFAVYKAVKEAVDNARKSLGPILIENFTYRVGDHSTSDDPSRYRPQKEVEEWVKKDPIARLEKYMKNNGILDDKYKAKVAEDARKEVEKEIEKYEKLPEPDKNDTFDYMFEEMPQQLKEQKEEFDQN
jgi:pyruvate dehydrogenase E1 component alpha subunit